MTLLDDPRGVAAARLPATRIPEIRWAALATLLFGAGACVQLLAGPPALYWTLYLACYAAGGWEPALAGLRALRARTLDVDLLMIVAAVAAAAIGQVFDGALLIVIFATSGALESYMTRRTAASVHALLDLAPARATRLTGGDTEVVAAADLVAGDVVLVRPGERVPADGLVVDGTSEVDRSSITGEPLPLPARPGDEVFAGTINGGGALRVRARRPAADSVIARIAALVEQASRTKAGTQLFVERVESRYAVAVVAATLLLVVVPLLYGAAFEPTLLRAMTFMIVASPCAVLLSTMPPLLAAVATAGRHGVLVKSAVVMERAGTATVVAFDKTGTLSEGTPRVVDVAPVRTHDARPDAHDAPPDPHDAPPGTHDARAGSGAADRLLAMAAAVTRDSEHPAARAITRAARERALPLPAATGFRSTPGEGVVATVHGRVVRVGSPALLAALPPGPERDRAAVLVADAGTAGHTAVAVLVAGAPAAVVSLADRARPDAAAAVSALTRLTGAAPVLLTGDNPRAARRFAAEVGIADVRAGLLPADKAREVAAMQAAGHHVLLVGDGVNDAPALATADVGVAMGRSGSDLALETADAVVVHDDLSTLPALVALSRRARRIVRANLAVAAAVVVVLVGWDLVATLPLPLGVAGHEGSTVAVCLNGLRLLRPAAWRRATRPGP